MSQRSGSPCSDRNAPLKRKKTNKAKYQQSQKISQHGQSKITHFFKNVHQKTQKNPKPAEKISAALQAELQSLKEQQQNLIYQKQHIIQQQLEARQEYQNWMRRSRELVQDCISQIFSNVRQKKGEIDPDKGFYDSNCRIFTQGAFGQSCQTKKIKYQQMLQNKEYNNQEEKQMIIELLINEQEKLKMYRKQLNSYKQRLKNAHEQRTCKFVDSWPLLNNRYQVVELLGKGGFSQVYKAYDLQQNKYIAIKRSCFAGLKTQLSHYLIQQYLNHLTLDHPNIVKLYQVVETTPNSVCIALQYCEGPELSAYIKQNQRIPQQKAKSIIKQVFKALNYMGSLDRKIVHFDLKPQNIMFSNGAIKILDFGLSKQIDSDHSRIALSNQGVGTYWYLPPEAFHEKNAEISQKVDIWSAGVILYEMLFGRKPFGHNKSQSTIINEGIILDANQVQFPDDIQVSDSAKSFIRHCLAYHPKNRFSSKQALSHCFFDKQMISY